MAGRINNKKSIWGFGLWGWDHCRKWRNNQYGDVFSKTEFAIERGFDVIPVSFSDLDALAPGELEDLYRLQQDGGVTYHPHAWAKWSGDVDSVKKDAEVWQKNIAKHARFYGFKLATSGLGGSRFSREMSVPEKIEHYSKLIAPMAKACHESGYGFAVENHVDYYVSDLVEMCRRTPHMGLFLDTGNSVNIGEKPIEAARDAAPYTLGLHFKDFIIKPNPGELKLECHGVALGSGDVGLREIYNIIMAGAPDPKNVLWEWELVCPRGEGAAMAALEQSIEFVNTL